VLTEAGDNLTRENLITVASGLKELETPMLR